MVREWQSGRDRNRDALVEHVHRVWEDIGARPDLCLNLVNSMPDRMQCVIEWDHGSHTDLNLDGLRYLDLFVFDVQVIRQFCQFQLE